jgi:hypothetical protein
LRARSSAGRWNLLWLGLWAGLVVNTKAIYILALPGAVAYLAPHLFRTQGARGLLRAVGWVLLGALPGLVMMLAYNQVRTGSFTNVGYALPITGATTRSFSENVFFGLYGLFLSPGKSLFLYSPPLLASLLALPRAWKTRERGWLWATLLTAGPVVYYNGTYLFWSGDWCWGPRYILFLVPMLLLPLAFLLDDLLAARRRLALAALGVLVAAGVFVQVLGGLFYWDHFIRISQDARNGWLGNPNRSGAASADRGGMCDPCFEDFYGFNWLPAFTPIEGHWWLLRHVPGKHDWRRAEADAPWHRYTTLQLNIAPSYSRARLDWWFLDWKGPLRAKGVVLLILLALGVGASSLPWWRGHRAGRRAGPGAHDGPAAEAPPVSDARS